jgi:antitoxin VapB
VPLYIKDNFTAEPAKRRGALKQDAAENAVQSERERLNETVPLRERLAALRLKHPLPPPTGQPADKAFFDELSGELE